MKIVIRQKLQQGESPEQVVQYFVDRYGEGVLLMPPPRSFNLLVWYVPPIALIPGLVVVWIFVRRSLARHRMQQQTLAVGTPIDDPTLEAYRVKVRRDLELAESEKE